MSEATLEQKYETMQEILRDLGSVAVAFSAGVDSTFVLKVAVDTLGADRVVAVTGRSNSLAKEEFEQAHELTEAFGAEHVVIDTDEFTNESYTSNPVDRCYHCKTALYTLMKRFIAERGTSAMVSGINADDYGDFRPGIEAGKEQGVRAPVAEAGLTKDDIRALSKRLGLVTHDKPASPCLASRVPYGEPITPEKLQMIEEGERFLRGLGVRECRVRHHGNMARIEVPVEFIPILAQPEKASLIDAHFRSLGYNYVALDMKGFRTGSMNEVIAFGKSQPRLD